MKTSNFENHRHRKTSRGALNMIQTKCQSLDGSPGKGRLKSCAKIKNKDDAVRFSINRGIIPRILLTGSTVTGALYKDVHTGY
ncbi:hypothetical protein NPIL_696491 [Nephila pilipes]|uniref:Uncharacterized protein n=1 Tax=Nephila pilipes TaxID=299642 RepID=A0A8X6IDA9_NEPPI|nr:hypothetical protein NPIL_696491 [Nephila pilipes]